MVMLGSSSTILGGILGDGRTWDEMACESFRLVEGAVLLKYCLNFVSYLLDVIYIECEPDTSRCKFIHRARS